MIGGGHFPIRKVLFFYVVRSQGEFVLQILLEAGRCGRVTKALEKQGGTA